MEATSRSRLSLKPRAKALSNLEKNIHCNSVSCPKTAALLYTAAAALDNYPLEAEQDVQRRACACSEAFGADDAGVELGATLSQTLGSFRKRNRIKDFFASRIASRRHRGLEGFSGPLGLLSLLVL